MQYLDLCVQRQGAEDRRRLGAQCVDHRPECGVHHAVGVDFVHHPRQDVMQDLAAPESARNLQGLGVVVGHIDTDAACTDHLSGRIEKRCR